MSSRNNFCQPWNSRILCKDSLSYLRISLKHTWIHLQKSWPMPSSPSPRQWRSWRVRSRAGMTPSDPCRARSYSSRLGSRTWSSMAVEILWGSLGSPRMNPGIPTTRCSSYVISILSLTLPCQRMTSLSPIELALLSNWVSMTWVRMLNLNLHPHVPYWQSLSVGG